MKKHIVIIFILIFLPIAFWLGEAGKGLFQLFPYLIGLVGTVAFTFFISDKWKYRTPSAFIFTILFAVAFYAGDCSFYKAYNTCFKKAELIRGKLSNYKVTNGEYPDELKDLNKPLPCSRCLRGTILKYESTGSSYKISFEDWLMEHSATDKKPFMAHK